MKKSSCLFGFLMFMLGNNGLLSQDTTQNQLPDINTASCDLIVPQVQKGNAAPGKLVKQTLEGYKSTDVYHLLYLPTNWEAGKTYPVIVEYPGNGPWSNDIGDISTGKVDGCNLGYGISMGKDYIWISMPFISEDGLRNQDWWWGDIEASKNYCIDAVKKICNEFGGNEYAVILSGFSRGAIATNYIGLHDNAISKLWAGFIVNSHFDGLKSWGYPDDDKSSAKKRLERLNGRPQFICAEGKGTMRTRHYLESTGINGDFTFLDIPYRNHTNTWVLHDIPERKVIRNWVAEVIKNK